MYKSSLLFLLFLSLFFFYAVALLFSFFFFFAAILYRVKKNSSTSFISTYTTYARLGFTYIFFFFFMFYFLLRGPHEFLPYLCSPPRLFLISFLLPFALSFIYCLAWLGFLSLAELLFVHLFLMLG